MAPIQATWVDILAAHKAMKIVGTVAIPAVLAFILAVWAIVSTEQASLLLEVRSMVARVDSINQERMSGIETDLAALKAASVKHRGRAYMRNPTR
jgi:hypothetical protein